MRRDTLVLVAILLAAGWIRCYALDAKSLWYDEAVSAAGLDFSFAETVGRKADAASVHPPLYFLLLHGWAAVFGDSVFALRWLAALCGVATVAGVYFFMRALCVFSNDTQSAGRVALWAAGLVALHPLQIVSSQQVRGYSLGTALLSWSSWALIRGLTAENRRTGVYWTTWAVLTVLLCYTSNLAVLSVAAQGFFLAIWLLGRYWRARREGFALLSPQSTGRAKTSLECLLGHRQLRWATLAGTIVLLAYGLPWFSRLLSQADTVRTTTGGWPCSLVTRRTGVPLLARKQ